MEPFNPTNPLELFLRLLFVIFVMLFAGVSTDFSDLPGGAGGSTGPGPEVTRVPLVIESVDVIALESDPMQLRLNVTGYQQDGCEFPVLVRQRRAGNTVVVEIFREFPTTVEMDCPQAIVPYEETIFLDGGFESGDYVIRVNDYAVDVSLGAGFVAPPPGGEPGAGGGDDGMSDLQPYRVPLMIESVEISVMESYPMQLALNVSGQWRDGCRTEVFIEQRREGNTVCVEIYRMHNPAMMCPTVLESHEARIMLDGGFESGHYTIRVNEHVTEIDL